LIATSLLVFLGGALILQFMARVSFVVLCSARPRVQTSLVLISLVKKKVRVMVLIFFREEKVSAVPLFRKEKCSSDKVRK
jgi:hypothetical protein